MRASESLHDRARAMPLHPGTCLDEAHAAVASLREERRRLERLGWETPLARCHEQLRYWEFMASVLSLTKRPEDARR